ncbi:MAG: hypothetical protein IIX02_05645 [Clostridia bacterium]|nr:hypothetical protein [Clostridia bacterium]
MKIGRFIAGLTFVAKVTGEDISDIDYMPGGMNQIQFTIAIESVLNALDNPFAITESEVTEEMFKDPDVTAGGTNANAVSKYTGDVTALGFAEGTTVYQYVGTDSVSDKAAIKVDSVNYDYVEFDFVIGSGDGYFFGYVLKNGSFLNNGASYVIDPSNLRLANGNAMDRVIQVFEANGQPAATLMKTNTLYKMRVFIKAGNVDQVMIAKTGSTIYLANVTFGLAADLPVEAPIKYSETQVSLPKYAGDVTALGFAEGATVYEQTIAEGWTDRVTVNVDNTYDYVDIQFVVPSGSLCLWVNNASGMLEGNYTVNSTGVVSAVNGALERKMQVLDEDGNVITSAMETGKVYTLRVYIEGLTKVQISTYSGATSIYYGEVTFGNEVVSDER